MLTKLRKKAQEGFTLIELMIVVAIIGILAAVAIPAFMKYIKKSKTTEAKQFVRKIYEGARTYYMEHKTAQGITGSTVAKQFPAGLTGTTPTTCCTAGNDKCAPDATLWTDPTWEALKFSVDDPHYYVYGYTTTDAELNFTARAFGDLDCDTNLSTFEMVGEINSDYSDGPAGSASIWSDSELE